MKMEMKKTALLSLMVAAMFVSAVGCSQVTPKQNVLMSSIPSMLEFAVAPGDFDTNEDNYYFLPPSLSPTSNCEYDEPYSLLLRVYGEGAPYVTVREQVTVNDKIVHVPVTVYVPNNYTGDRYLRFYIRAFVDPGIPGCTLMTNETPYMDCSNASVKPGMVNVLVLGKKGFIDTNYADAIYSDQSVPTGSDYGDVMTPLAPITVLYDTQLVNPESNGPDTGMLVLVAIAIAALIVLGVRHWDGERQPHVGDKEVIG